MRRVCVGSKLRGHRTMASDSGSDEGSFVSTDSSEVNDGGYRALGGWWLLFARNDLLASDNVRFRFLGMYHSRYRATQAIPERPGHSFFVEHVQELDRFCDTPALDTPYSVQPFDWNTPVPMYTAVHCGGGVRLTET